jgi:hypothetical protein
MVADSVRGAQLHICSADQRRVMQVIENLLWELVPRNTILNVKNTGPCVILYRLFRM